MTKLFFAFIVVSPLTLFAQEEAVTSDGKVVLLFADNTWKYKPISSDSVSSDSTAMADFGDPNNSSTVASTAKKSKIYSDSISGFRGFLKPELKLSTLPEQSEGLYVFRVKINKEGLVREVTTTQRGPNGQAEAVMRNSITKMKFMPNGSVVAPLTEGTIRITVPTGY